MRPSRDHLPRKGETEHNDKRWSGANRLKKSPARKRFLPKYLHMSEKSSNFACKIGNVLKDIQWLNSKK